MKRFLVILVMAAATRGAVPARAAADAPPGIDDRFVAGRIAYDAGKFSEALQHYEGIRAQGIVSSQLYYNMGNALVRLGRMGEAALAYRRALYLRPRDPDAAANLRFTMNLSGALVPSYRMPTILLGRLNAGEWAAVAIAAYWLCAIALCIHRLHPRRPRMLFHATVLSATVLVVAALGVLRWRSFEREPEMVVLKGDVQSLFAPLERATPHFKVPEGSIVRRVGQSGAWTKIAAGADEGWIPSDAGESVLPLR